MTSEEVTRIFEEFAKGGPDRETVRRLTKDLGHDRKTFHKYLGVLRLIVDLSVTLPITEDKWKQLEPLLESYTGQSSLVTRHFVEDLLRSYTPWKQEVARRLKEQVSSGKPPVPMPPHIEALLKARDRLAEQVLKLLDPEGQLLSEVGEEAVNEKPDRAKTPACLEREQLPPGEVISEPAFKWLREHTEGDPHWVDLQVSQYTGLNEGLWWTEYWGYRSRLSNLLAHSVDDCRQDLHKVTHELGNSSSPMVGHQFVARPIRDALRAHLGRPPLAQNELEIQSRDLNGRESYVIMRGGVRLVSGIDDRGKPDSALIDAVLEVLESFEKQILTSPEPRSIVESWDSLKKRAEEFARWLQSLTPEDLNGGTCSTCQPSSTP